MGGLVRASIAIYLKLPVAVRVCVPILWMGALWLISSRPGGIDRAPIWKSLVSNSAHVGVYAVLAAMLALSIRPGRHRWWLAAVIAIAYGIIDEIHQSFVPRREADIADVASDAVGAVAAVIWLRGVSELDHRRWWGWVALLACVGVGTVLWASLG